MALGDVVNGIGPANTLTSFQPAAGVEVILTHVSMNSQWIYLGTAAGAGSGLLLNSSIQAGQTVLDAKVCINNTNFVWFNAGAASSANWSGIQIK
tara:strand:+ start:368 stop:652 length:285 start_codon:yes stop_codon:yes gene_type:complete